MERHFRHLGMAIFRNSPVTRDVSRTMMQSLVSASRTDLSELLDKLHTRADGLTEQEADTIRAAVGPNEVEVEKPLTWRAHLWRSYKNPFNLLLTVLAVVSYYTEDMKAAIVIGAMVILSTLMRCIQELRSSNTADKLKEMVSNTATVIRHDITLCRVEVPIRKLVPGDIVQLSAGDMIPADLRLLSAKDLFVSQAAMTGESLPVEKFAEHHSADAGSPLELCNLCFMGTSVVSGSATAVILTTGNSTCFGALAERVTATDRAPTAFQAGVNKVGWLLIRFMLVMTPVVFFINGFTKGDWLEAFLFGLSIAVGLTPEMLPMIVTSTLAKGVVALSRKKVVVKRLDAIQNFGAMDVLCTDKTGTLTQDRIFLERHTGILGEPNDAVLQYAYLNSCYQTGLKNLKSDGAGRRRAGKPQNLLQHAQIHQDDGQFQFRQCFFGTGGGHFSALPANVAAGQLFQAASAATGLLPMAASDPDRLRCADPADEAVVRPTLRLAVIHTCRRGVSLHYNTRLIRCRTCSRSRRESHYRHLRMGYREHVLTAWPRKNGLVFVPGNSRLWA